MVRVAERSRAHAVAVATPEAPADSPEVSDQYLVQSLIRGLDLLQCFDKHHPSLSIAEIAEHTGLNRTTVFRFMHTLRHQQLVDYDAETRRFRLGVGVLQLGFAYLNGLPVVDRAVPLLRALRDEVGESAHLGILDGSAVIYVARVPADRIVSATVSVGARLPAASTAMGRVLLAYQPPQRLATILRGARLERRTERSPRTVGELRRVLDEVRRAGYAVSNQEYEEGICSVASPVIGETGEVVAAVNVAGPTTRLTPAILHARVVPAVVRTAARVSLIIGGTPTATAS
ncbi:MAG: IclR family transcriptional regulator C-terminal domain-containing protein [Chloroflexota bacterium]